MLIWRSLFFIIFYKFVTAFFPRINLLTYFSSTLSILSFVELMKMSSTKDNSLFLPSIVNLLKHVVCLSHFPILFGKKIIVMLFKKPSLLLLSLVICISQNGSDLISSFDFQSRVTKVEYW